MADIFRKTTADREEEAGLAPSSKPPPKLPPPPAVDFVKGYTPEERARQQAKLIELLRNR